MYMHGNMVCMSVLVWQKWTHWGLNPGPSACEADVIPLHHAPNGVICLAQCHCVFCKSNSVQWVVHRQQTENSENTLSTTIPEHGPTSSANAEAKSTIVFWQKREATQHIQMSWCFALARILKNTFSRKIPENSLTASAQKWVKSKIVFWQKTIRETPTHRQI